MIYHVKEGGIKCRIITHALFVGPTWTPAKNAIVKQ